MSTEQHVLPISSLIQSDLTSLQQNHSLEYLNLMERVLNELKKASDITEKKTLSDLYEKVRDLNLKTEKIYTAIFTDEEPKEEKVLH